MLNVDECVKLRELADISDGEVEMEVEVEVFQPRPYSTPISSSRIPAAVWSAVIGFNVRALAAAEVLSPATI